MLPVLPRAVSVARARGWREGDGPRDAGASALFFGIVRSPNFPRVSILGGRACRRSGCAHGCKTRAQVLVSDDRVGAPCFTREAQFAIGTLFAGATGTPAEYAPSLADCSARTRARTTPCRVRTRKASPRDVRCSTAGKKHAALPTPMPGGSFLSPSSPTVAPTVRAVPRRRDE